MTTQDTQPIAHAVHAALAKAIEGGIVTTQDFSTFGIAHAPADIVAAPVIQNLQQRHGHCVG